MEENLNKAYDSIPFSRIRETSTRFPAYKPFLASLFPEAFPEDKVCHVRGNRFSRQGDVFILTTTSPNSDMWMLVNKKTGIPYRQSMQVYGTINGLTDTGLNSVVGGSDWKLLFTKISK